MNQETRIMRRANDVLVDVIKAVGSGTSNAISEGGAFHAADITPQITFLFVEEGLTVSDEKLQIPCLGMVDGRVVDFVHDPVGYGKPDVARSGIGRTHCLLGT